MNSLIDVYQYFDEELPSILRELPLGLEDYKIAIYGLGVHTERLLEKYVQCVGEIKAHLIFIDSNKKTMSEKYNGYDVYNIYDIGGVQLDLIIISSSLYEKDMYQKIKELYDDKFKVYRFYENGKPDIFIRKGVYLPPLSLGKLEKNDNYERKHAYLIAAHNEFDLLEKELQLLDSDNADIYLHIDARCKKVDYEKLKSNLTKSGLYFVKRIKVTWGGHSQIKCTLNMLKSATEKGYQYYHLLSGVDLPLKTPKEINEVFDRFNGYEFVACENLINGPQYFIDRVKYYHFFRNLYGRNTSSVLCDMEKRLIDLQKKLKINRIKNKEHMFYKGSNWFSITHKMSIHILNNKRLVRKYCYNSLCGDEIFIQTLVMNSPYANDVVRKNLREIDWDRGNPYVFRNGDYEELMSSENLFARKFSSMTDSQIIDRIYNELKLSNN